MAKALEIALVEEKIITKEQADAALKEVSEKGGTLEAAIGRLGFATEEAIARFIASSRVTQFVDLSRLSIPPELIKLVPTEVARKYHAIPVRKMRDKFTFAVVDPSEASLIHLTDDLFRGRPGTADFVVSCDSMIVAALENYYQVKVVNTLDSTMSDVGGIKTVEGVEGPALEDVEVMPESVDTDPDQVADEAPVKRLVNSILFDAIERHVSDIHLDPVEDGLIVRFRMDGVLQDMSKVPSSFKKPVIAVLKVMTKQMKIEEKRRPQDAKIKVKIGGRTVDLRVSTLPVVWGEKVVMRILDQGNLNVDLKGLGFEAEQLEKFEKAIHSPYGMCLITGPTGSGKTTTLYSALSTVNTRGKNIMTAEDPVEYQLKGINQVPVNPDVGMTYAAALKAFLRQDPNIVMIGEIRDFETAEIAIKAAMTGQMVLSTLHTNDAPSTITRLVDMKEPKSGVGIDPVNIATAVNLVVAQRLLRKICEKCKKPFTYTAEQLQFLSVDPKDIEGAQLMKGEGCSACNKTGHKGRVAIYEVMPMSKEIRNMLMKGTDTNDIRVQAIKEGMSTLRMSALLKAKAGLSTLEEVQRVTLE